MEIKTLRFTRLVEPDFNCGTWLKTILEKVRSSEIMYIQVGFSFIALNKQNKIYLFCPKALAPYTVKCTDKSEATAFADKLEKMTQNEHLENIFLKTETGNPFNESGYCPNILVANYIWISK